MATITTSAHPKALWPGVKAWFGAQYDRHEREYTELFDVQTSSQHFEEIVETTGFGLAPRKTEGGTYMYVANGQGATKRFVHVAYGLGYVVTREELADNKYESLSRQRSSSLAFSMNQTRENVGAQVYNRAFTSTFVGADGKELCATDHPTYNGGTFSNELSTAASFSEAALEDLTIQIMQAEDSLGLPAALKPMKLIGPVNLIYDFHRVLHTTLQPDSALNNINALKATNAVPSFTVNHYFSDSNNWFLRTNAPQGMLWFDREGVSFDKDQDFDTDNAKTKAYMRFSVGWVDPRAIYGSAPA